MVTGAFQTCWIGEGMIVELDEFIAQVNLEEGLGSSFREVVGVSSMVRDSALYGLPAC